MPSRLLRTEEQLAHLSPTEWRHINPYGDYHFDLTPLAGHRPLRAGFHARTQPPHVLSISRRPR